MATLERTMHDTAVQALTQQEAALEALRARTGTLLTASSLVASFLGGQGIARHGLSLWIDLALAAFGCTAILSIHVLLPRGGLAFALDPAATYRLLAPYATDERATDLIFATWLQGALVANGRAITSLSVAARAAGATFIAEIVLLAVGLV